MMLICTFVCHKRLTVPIACAHERFLCSGKSAEGDKNDTKVEKDGTGTNVSEKDQARNDQENRSIQAKAKLNSLLQSIVQVGLSVKYII